MSIKLPPIKPRPPGARKRPHKHAPLAAASERPPTTHGYVKSFDGTRLFYSVEGNGRPLVFCYGLVCSSLHWTYQIEHFRRNYQAIWFDYRGHQNSEVPKNLGSLTVENLARDLGVILDELAVKDAVILGHSMGVNAVLEFYRQQPERVAGMVLANGTPRRPLETLFRNNALQAGFKLLKKAYQHSPELVQAFWKMQKGNPLAHTIIQLGGFNPHLTPPEDVAMYVDQVAEMSPSVFINLIENYDHVDCTAWLHEIRKPTLIIAGEEDKIVPIELQELMNQLIPGSRLERIRHGSHCAQMDLPDLVNLKIEKFLAEINYGPAPDPEHAPRPTPTTETSSRSTLPSEGPGLEGAS